MEVASILIGFTQYERNIIYNYYIKYHIVDESLLKLKLK